MTSIIYSLLPMLICTQLYACNGNNPTIGNNISKMDSIKVKITIGQKTATAILYDNPTSKDFVALLPLTLEKEDYNRTEKINLLSQKLTSKNASSGFDPSVGDINYYEPWGNIALFYKDFGYSNGLISLGKITSGLEAFEVSGTVTAKFELD
ncbi:MAG: cyclophilin-like fold protein [Niabella sp.]